MNPTARYLCVCLLLVFRGGDAGAQSHESPNERRAYLAFSPAKLADPLHRGLLVAVGLHPGPDWSLEAGYLRLFRDQPNRLGNRGVDRGGRMHLAAFRHLPVDRVGTTSSLLGARFDYLRADYTYTYYENTLREFLTITPGPGNPQAGLAHEVLTFNLLAGIRSKLLGRLYIDFQLGPGARYRRSRLRDTAPSALSDQIDLLGDRWTINLPCDLRLLFAL